jgi:SAM-dependent methyltransferase
VTSSTPSSSSEHERHNRVFWDADADDYQAAHVPRLDTPTWGVWELPESDVGVVGDVAGLHVLELGCGDARWSVHLERAGARVVALDLSLQQLGHARALERTAGTSTPLVCASAEAVPLTGDGFDLVMCDHGAMSFCEPERAVAEAARLLRVGGRLVFSHTTPWPYLTWNFEKEHVGRRLRRSYFGIHRFDDGAGEGTVDFQLPYGEWIRCFRRHGLVVDDLVELQAPEHATTTYDDFDARWARRWPAEQIWVTRKE